ncbi:BamA/TamA family outer membrane protein [Lewinella sp. W8]|uniref:BamA/TamA family outer membrane protein n=1 Tax=Lewinella sp. W8 TaxID=2528208 RepID=UPI001067949E|nr:BamA/TamA family outer membrane protein [Lewinella sp. W8]MTB53456.1 BamA/TamA family outer membrane protein [Lewinella sp. W8]
MMPGKHHTNHFLFAGREVRPEGAGPFGLPVWFFLSLLSLALGASSCNVTKYLPENEYLYRGASVTIEAPDSVSVGDLELAANGVLENSTNQKVPLLGYYSVWRYYRWQEKADKRPEKYEGREEKGDEPIFYDDRLAGTVSTLLENRASNSGYFNNEVSYQLDTNRQTREISVAYELRVGHPYRLDSTAYFLTDSSVAKVIRDPEVPNLLEPGTQYNLDLIKTQRQNWELALRRAGYYYARSDDFLFLADTVAGNHQVDMLVKLKDGVPPNHLAPQRIVEVNVYPNRDPQVRAAARRPDTTRVGGLTIICEDCPLRPEIVDEGFAQSAGDLYSPVKHDKTLRRLADYNTFRYISLNYERVPGTDTALVLNAYLQPRLRRRFEGEVGLTYNNAQYFGPNLRLAYINRNLFRGAELLRIEGDFSYAVFLGDDNSSRIPRSGIYGLTASLQVPRMWLPWQRKENPQLITSGTVVEMSGKLETLNLNLAGFSGEIETQSLGELAEIVETDSTASERISLLQIGTKLGYTWRQRIDKTHLFYPFSLRFQNPGVRNEEVLDLARGLGVAPGTEVAGPSRFDRMIVLSPEYIFNYDTRKDGTGKHELFWQQTVSLNWNNIFPVGTRNFSDGRETSIYPILETDLRYYWSFSSQQQLAIRLHGGIAYPFSERAIVPYFDLFTIGGPNSLRGFIPRQLGPGRTAPINNNLLTFGGYGNVLLESSVEFRQRLFYPLELALFADAGNIWTYRTELEPLDTDFRAANFFRELALNAGVGFRFDLQFLVLRLDLAKPLRIPYEDILADQRIPNRVVGDAPDRSLRYVIAFGYPF